MKYTNTPAHLVSIITPSLNQGRFIEKTIQSVLSQNYENIEYVVVDGASTDETIDVLRNYGDRIRWISEPDQGQAHAINKGIRLTSGNYLCYLNSDDVLKPNAVGDMVEVLVAHPEVDVLYGNATYVCAEGETLRPYDVGPWDFGRFKEECFICQPATMWTRKCISKYGMFDESLDIVMDYEYWMRIAVYGGEFYYLEKLLAESRDYPETKSRSAQFSRFKEIMKVSKYHTGSVSPAWRLKRWGYIGKERLHLPRPVLKAFHAILRKVYV